MTVRIGSLTISGITRDRLGWWRWWARQSGNVLRVVR